MNEDIGVQRLVARAEGDPDVLGIILFGSQARGDAGPGSDIDVCVVLGPDGPSGPAASHKRLDYLAGSDLDVKIFQQLPLYVRSRILKEGRVVFVRDEDRLYELAIRTARAFEDFRPYYQRATSTPSRVIDRHIPAGDPGLPPKRLSPGDRGQRACQRGLRFSAKARGPSMVSSERRIFSASV